MEAVKSARDIYQEARTLLTIGVENRRLITEFLNNKRSHTFLKTYFFLKDYQNPYVKLHQKIRSLRNEGGSSNF